MSQNDRLAKTADKLLNVAKMRCDEVKAELAAIRVARESTQTALAQLDHSLLQEQRRVELAHEREGNSDIDPAEVMANRYADKIRINRTNMIATLDQLDAREVSLKEALGESHAELKKYERLMEINDRRERDKNNEREERHMQEFLAARKRG